MTIQEQLRGEARWLEGSAKLVTAPRAMLDAADRIDALEAALRNIIAADQVKVGAEPIDPNDRRGHWRDVIKDGKSARVAREALGAAAKEATDGV